MRKTANYFHIEAVKLAVHASKTSKDHLKLFEQTFPRVCMRIAIDINNNVFLRKHFLGEKFVNARLICENAFLLAASNIHMRR